MAPGTGWSEGGSIHFRRRGRGAIRASVSNSSVRVGSGFKARETPRRKLINTEFGVKTFVIKTLLTWWCGGCFGPVPLSQKCVL